MLMCKEISKNRTQNNNM